MDSPSRSAVGRFFALADDTSVQVADTPFRYPEIWARQLTPETGVARLCIGGGEDPVKLLVTLAQALTEPLFVLALIDASTGQTGKYESGAMTYPDVAAFFDEFGRLFAAHGRAEAWVGSTQDSGLVVLDEHDLLYAYGPLDEFEAILPDRGYKAGFPEVPVPHAHALDVELAEQLRFREWPGWARVLPLEEKE
jgi:hypothetical protein